MSHTAILLLAHGTPNALGEMADYLQKVTGGRPMPPHVIEELQHRYAQIGLRNKPLPGGPPLTRWTLRQAALLEDEACTTVYVGMRNWHPFIAETVARMKADGVTHARVLCLAPQNSRTSTGLYRRALEEAIASAPGGAFTFDFISGWADDPLLAQAFAERLWPTWAEACAITRTRVPVLFTAHSVPCRTILSSPPVSSNNLSSRPEAAGRSGETRRSIASPPVPADGIQDYGAATQGDPYPVECKQTAAAVAKLLAPVGMTDRDWYFAFQSQGVAGALWIGPTVEDTLKALAEEGHRAIVIQPIGFLCDHVEILYDIDIHFRDFARGLSMVLWRAESLNDSRTLIRALDHVLYGDHALSREPEPELVAHKIMTRIAIVGGGISGLTAAYELELARRCGAPLDWHLYEATDRLGGIIETTRHSTPEGDFILEGGPDAWVTEKPWARELAIELGLEDQLIYSNDATRKTYILKTSGAGENIAGVLLPIPDRMRLMVPETLSALDNSPLFSDSAKRAYHYESHRSAELKTSAPSHDESVASFIRRHFGQEVLEKIGAPLLSGVFGGDVEILSVRAVMPQFVAMEREHGSLIAALQARSKQRTAAPEPIFTSLRNGMVSLIEALIIQLPPERLHSSTLVSSTTPRPDLGTWSLSLRSRHPERSGSPASREVEGSPYSAHARDELITDHVLLATSLDATRNLLESINAEAAALLPQNASSATLATLCWPQKMLSGRALHQITVPKGFGFLVPPSDEHPTQTLSSRPESSHREDAAERPAVQGAGTSKEPQLLACTFVDQKFPHRAPTGDRILRAFFGSRGTDYFTDASNEEIAHFALAELRTVMGPLPDPAHELTAVRRLPRSLPQYEVGHLDRIAQLEILVAKVPGLHLLGNSYRGVGLPDLIRDARTTARSLISDL